MAIDEQSQEEAMQAIRGVAEMAAGYRETLIREGIPVELADLMTQDYARIFWVALVGRTE